MYAKSVLLFFYVINIVLGQDVCYKDKCQNNEESRYLFYDVNPPEGFNLRRDVYMRMAVLAHKLKNSKDPSLNKFKLVLPNWSHLMHWSYSESPEYIPWSRFFDIKSLQAFAPVIELHEFFTNSFQNKFAKVNIDNVYILQHFPDMFETGNFEERWEEAECLKPPKLRFFYYANITSNNIKCLSFHGPATKIIEILKQTTSRTIFIDHAEVALHDTFGSKIYWQARRSMRFNLKLREIACKYRKQFLESTDDSDDTFLAPDWRSDKPKRSAVGGPYIAIHLRRRDFIKGRPNDVPDLNSVANQIREKLVKLNLSKVFIATDAPKAEYEELKSKLLDKYTVFKYVATKDIEAEYGDGGVAIIDQIICSYARYFIGTSESTFSFRIQEEREILGFPVDTTFNALCKDDKACKKPSVWKIVY